MDESLQLLSSMSPKITIAKRRNMKKGATVLALKKHFRKSSIYDNAKPTIKNDSLVLLESSSADSSPSENEYKSTTLLKDTPIVISDTDVGNSDLSDKCREDSSKVIKHKNEKANIKSQGNKGIQLEFLSHKRKCEIQSWVDTVTINDSFTETSKFNELSPMQGETCNPEVPDIAISSPFIDSASRKFDEVFKNDINRIKNLPLNVDQLYGQYGSDTSSQDSLRLNGSTEKVTIRRKMTLKVATEARKSLKKSLNEENVLIINDSFDNLCIEDSLILSEANIKINTELKRENETDKQQCTEKKLQLIPRISCLRDNISTTNEVNLIKIPSEGNDHGVRSSSCTNKKPTYNNGDSTTNSKLNTPSCETKDDTHTKNSSWKNEFHSDAEVCSLLDDLYGNSWRQNQDSILSLSERKPNRILKQNTSKNIPKTEQKPKVSLLYKNPYVAAESIKSSIFLRELHKARIKAALESPWRSKLKSLCDSESSQDESEENILHPTKLIFGNDGETDSGSLKTDSKATKRLIAKSDEPGKNPFKNVFDERNSSRTSDKENTDFSDLELGKSLEERIRKKTDGVKISSKPLPVTKSKNLFERTNFKQADNKLTKPIGDDWRKEKVDELCDPVKTQEDKIRKKVNNIRDPAKTAPVNRTKKIPEQNLEAKTKITRERNTKKKLPKKNFDSFIVNSDTSDDEDGEWSSVDSSEKKHGKTSGKLPDTYSFLASLSGSVPISKCDMSARIYRNNFKQYRDQLTQKLFTLYNSRVFDNVLPDTMEIVWNDRLRGTAGKCYCKKITRRTGVVERSATIQLSSKVLDSADRLRDTLLHELCHAVTWIVNQVHDGHGAYWKSWANKAMKTFPEIPPVTRCHTYKINTKYTYKCTSCGYGLGRHTKSLDLERKRCGYCLGTFELLLNKKSKKGENKSVPVTDKKATGFALFVKEHYAIHKTHQLSHAEVMKLLGQKFKEMKT